MITNKAPAGFDGKLEGKLVWYAVGTSDVEWDAVAVAELEVIKWVSLEIDNKY
jgi:hypothetical protein